MTPTLPEWANANHPEARRGTPIVQRLDPKLIVAHVNNPPQWVGLEPNSFVLFGPSTSTGRYELTTRSLAASDGYVYRSNVPWYVVTDWLAQKYAEHIRGITTATRMAEHNARVDAQKRQADNDLLKEVLKETAPIIEAEQRGTSRHDPADVIRSIRRDLAGEKSNA